jgi:hypothetical protein
MSNTADVTGGKPIAVQPQSVLCVSAVNPLVAFYDIMEERERCYSFILSRTPHETVAQVRSTTVKVGRLTTCHVRSIPHS